MTHFLKTTRSILLVFGLLTSGSGCHVLSIPVNQAGELGGFSASCGGSACSGESLEGVPTGSDEPHCYTVDGGCPPGWLSPLPERQFVGWPVPHMGLPVPQWWANWKAKKDLPEPPAYPRFHPLPTRPMFQPRPTPSNDHLNGSTSGPVYGQLPDTHLGRSVWEASPATREMSHFDTLPPAQ